MDRDTTLERQEAHALIDRLPPEKLPAVRSLLEIMVDPLAQKLASASLDDEPESEQERVAAAEAIESLSRGGGVAMEVVLSDFGLTLEDFRRMANPVRNNSTRG